MTNNTLPQSPVSVAEQIAWLASYTFTEGRMPSGKVAGLLTPDVYRAILASLKRLEACERDAARYRWLRDEQNERAFQPQVTQYKKRAFDVSDRVALYDEQLDAAIDSARSS